MNYRKGNIKDVDQFVALGIKSWYEYKDELDKEQWLSLYALLNSRSNYESLLTQATCFIAEDEQQKIVGMAFLVPNGNPTDIYLSDWCYIRMVSVDPAARGQKIGEQLTKQCLEHARKNGEKTIALHTSEMMYSARHIYEKMGFTVLREIDQRLGKRYYLYTLIL